MIKIPQSGKFSQTNQSDLFGNIFYTKNINFDEEGYLKLENRCVSLLSEETEANFDVVTGFGRYASGSFYLATGDQPYILTMQATDFSIAEDTDSGGDTPPNMTFQTSGLWWRNLWHATTSTKLYYKTPSNGNWTDTSVSLTASIPHPLCSFGKANTLLVGNGNVVKQLDSSYATTSLAQLTISTEYEVVGIAYNDNQAGILTRLASSISSQNKEAVFLTWDGSEASANGMYNIGSDTGIAIAPYKSSFVIITRAGELLYFNGGGFEKLAAFPVYFNDVVWGNFISQDVFGDAIQPEGDTLYINIPAEIDYPSQEIDYLENFIGGVWVYDPAVGLYHKYAPSVSPCYSIVCADSGVDLTTNTITRTSGTIPSTGSEIKFMGGSIGGLTVGKMYYCIKSSSTSFKVATTKANALAFISIDLTSASGDSYFIGVELKDYGQCKTSRCGAVALQGEKSALVDNILFSGDLFDNDSLTSADAHINVSIADFKNIGYFVTPKIYSQNVQDVFQKLFVKYRPLKTNDKIILKYKEKEYVNIPVNAGCTVTSTTTLTTTNDIAEAYNFTGELECETIFSAGSGQMKKITSITENAGTYTITLSEELEGVSVSDVVGIKIDNWKVLDTITSADSENWKEIPIATNSKWLKIKVVLEGTDTTIEELQIISTTHLPSV